MYCGIVFRNCNYAYNEILLLQKLWYLLWQGLRRHVAFAFCRKEREKELTKKNMVGCMEGNAIDIARCDSLWSISGEPTTNRLSYIDSFASIALRPGR